MTAIQHKANLKLQEFKTWFTEISLSDLKGNLQEIYCAAHSERKFPAELVANCWGTHLYDSTIGWGRFWKYIYKITDLIFRQHLHQDKVTLSLLKTHACF